MSYEACITNGHNLMCMKYHLCTIKPYFCFARLACFLFFLKRPCTYMWLPTFQLILIAHYVPAILYLFHEAEKLFDTHNIFKKKSF